MVGLPTAIEVATAKQRVATLDARTSAHRIHKAVWMTRGNTEKIRRLIFGLHGA